MNSCSFRLCWCNSHHSGTGLSGHIHLHRLCSSYQSNQEDRYSCKRWECSHTGHCFGMVYKLHSGQCWHRLDRCSCLYSCRYSHSPCPCRYRHSSKVGRHTDQCPHCRCVQSTQGYRCRRMLEHQQSQHQSTAHHLSIVWRCRALQIVNMLLSVQEWKGNKAVFSANLPAGGCTHNSTSLSSLVKGPGRVELKGISLIVKM